MEDIVAFGTTLLIGAFMGILFDFYRGFRRVTKPNKILSLIEDLLFWISIISIFFALLVLTTDGIQRGFVYFGCLVGLSIYMFLLSKLILPIFVFIFRLILKLINEIMRVIIYPFKGIIKRNKVKKMIMVPGIVYKEMGKYVKMISKKK